MYLNLERDLRLFMLTKVTVVLNEYFEHVSNPTISFRWPCTTNKELSQL